MVPFFSNKNLKKFLLNPMKFFYKIAKLIYGKIVRLGIENFQFSIFQLSIFIYLSYKVTQINKN